MISPLTQEWIRNPSDEKAAANGCRFDVERALFTVFWVERYCRLYEGEGNDGVPITLRGCHQCGTYNLPPAIDFDDFEDAKPHFLERARRYNECRAAGHAVDWQFECVMRIFGWTVYSEKWRRWVRRFRKAIIFVAKKNKKSPTLAAIGYYLLAGDGEPGQKVFICASNGMQARKIVGEHAVKIYEQLDEDVQPDFSLNKNSMRISYTPTNSFMEPLSSSNVRSKNDKHGLNGSFITDETHVVDRAFKDIITRAGISRSEPLDIEVSTAGNNPDDYGKERFDYGLKIQSGEIEDQETFAAIYAAPQDLKDEDLDADPLKYARMANPALGHTIDPQEFLHDYRTTKTKSLADMAVFKYLRLNIWAQTASPWLDKSDWDSCKIEFEPEDMAGETCSAGMDLAMTRDMTSVVLTFPRAEGRYRLLPFFFLPEAGFRRLIPVLPQVHEWRKSGALIVTPGNDLDYEVVKEKLAELSGRYQIHELIYDPKYANHISQQIEEELQIPRFAFGQSLGQFAEPTAMFEKLVLGRKLEHNGHPIMDWQMGHVNVFEKGGYKRPVKPNNQPTKKIDGVVAGIMSLAGAMRIPADDWWTPDAMLH